MQEGIKKSKDVDKHKQIFTAVNFCTLCFLRIFCGFEPFIIFLSF